MLIIIEALIFAEDRNTEYCQKHYSNAATTAISSGRRCELWCTIRTTASISNSGADVTCTGIVFGNAKDPISAKMKLWRDNTCIATWSANGTGNLTIVKTKSVTKGHTYKVTVDANVAGVKQQRVTSSSLDY